MLWNKPFFFFFNFKTKETKSFQVVRPRPHGSPNSPKTSPRKIKSLSTLPIQELHLILKRIPILIIWHISNQIPY